MQLLTAVNAILPKLGERPVTSLESRNPTLGVILPQIDMDIGQILMAGWWFNTYFNVDLFPNSEGQIDVPDDTLSFVTNAESTPAVQRGEMFYNPTNRSYKFDGKITGTLRQRLGFEDLPESAAQVVLYSSLVTCYSTDIGLEQIVQQWMQYARAAQAAMEQEHLRQRKYSIKQSRRYQNLRRAMRG
ncbi:tail protein [Ralstonia phage phiAp1]|uniref:Tail tubular A n=1 Tax=Ralstonia phage phiAp1 TaxID=2783867 RepID=A0A1L7DS59_9CAUD|nr:tail protein [Ralstonia phage phiAp1]APU03182.1 tail tubular A [Ralstonia phage phiAp1]